MVTDWANLNKNTENCKHHCAGRKELCVTIYGVDDNGVAVDLDAQGNPVGAATVVQVEVTETTFDVTIAVDTAGAFEAPGPAIFTKNLDS